MSDQNKNLELWNSVEKTDPKHTRKANIKGNRITSIDPQYQIKKATAKFGSYGSTWGLRNIKVDYTLVPVNGLVFWVADFYYPNGEFPISNSTSVWMDNARTKPDDQFAKKIETDSLTKALSKIGFNADVFLGKYDDSRYVEEVTKEFKVKGSLSTTDFANALDSVLKGTSNTSYIKDNFKLTEEQIKSLESVDQENSNIYKELKELYSLKNEAIKDDYKKSIHSIISEKKVLSYSKAINYLKTL